MFSSMTLQRDQASETQKQVQRTKEHTPTAQEGNAVTTFTSQYSPTQSTSMNIIKVCYPENKKRKVCFIKR
jgi:hypothetical protein